MCMMAITFLNLIGIPMEIAFLDGVNGLGWEGFNVFSDTLFLIDVALNFRMGIIPEDSEVEEGGHWTLFLSALCLLLSISVFLLYSSPLHLLI